MATRFLTAPFTSRLLTPLHRKIGYPLHKNRPSSSPFRTMTSPSSNPWGPIHARIMSDPSYYRDADTESQVAVEIAFAEETFKSYFSDVNQQVAYKGPLDPAALTTLAAATANTTTKMEKEHTAVWHVLYKDRKSVKIVYAYAHLEDTRPQTDDAKVGPKEKERRERGFSALVGVLRDELRRLEGEGRLVGGGAFGIAQGGTVLSFIEFRGDSWDGVERVPGGPK